jgi:predicted metalloendopeptidase
MKPYLIALSMAALLSGCSAERMNPAAAAPVIGGFTADQRFFMAHAQIWRGMQREDALRNQILTNPHAPFAARGSIPERNMDAWYAAFGVKEGDKLFIKPEDRVKIW